MINRRERYNEIMLVKFGNPLHKDIAGRYLTIRKEVDNVALSTRNIDLTAIYHLSNFLKNKAFSEATRQDIRDYVNHLQKRMSNATSNLYAIKIKRFYKFVSEPDKYENGKQDQKEILYPNCVKWIAYDAKANAGLPLDTILSENEIKQMLKACRNSREQALLVILFDGGLRKSEIINLKIENVGFDRQLGAYLLLPKKAENLKTGMRKIQLFIIPSSTQYIRDYLNHHKYNDDPKAPLFCSEDTSVKTEKKPLSDQGVADILTRILKNAGIKKHITPHTCRHWSATMACMMGFNEIELRLRYGWSRESKMPSRYVDLASIDVSDKIKKIRGIKEDIPKDRVLQVLLCPNCEYENVPTNIVCGRCGMKLNIKKEDLGADATTTGIATQEMLKDPEFREYFNDMLALTWEKYMKKKENKN